MTNTPTLEPHFVETARRNLPIARARLHGDDDRAAELAERLEFNHDGGGPEWDEGYAYRSWALDNGMDPEADETFDIWMWGPYLDRHPERPETAR